MSVALAPEVALVLSLHGVVDEIEHPAIQVNHLEVAAFERLVDHVRTRFDVVSLDDIAAALAGERTLPSPAAALTFDDGYRSVAELADPILRRRGLPYAIFVPPALIDAGARVPTYVMRAALELTNATSIHLPGSRRAAKLRTPDEREQTANRAAEALRSLPQAEVAPLLATLRGLLSDGEWAEADSRFASEALLTWDELRALAAGGVLVGSHTRDHAVLHENQPDAEIEAQVVGSRATIEERLGVACRHFCYPHGSPRDVSAASVRAVRTAGYSCAFMNVGGPVREGMDAALLPRVAMVGSGPEAALAPRVLLSHSKWYAELAPRVGT